MVLILALCAAAPARAWPMWGGGMMSGGGMRWGGRRGGMMGCQVRRRESHGGGAGAVCGVWRMCAWRRPTNLLPCLCNLLEILI